MQFTHQWLSDDFAGESQQLAEADQQVGGGAKDHHYVPVFFLKRWADGDGLVQPTLVDTKTTHQPQRPRDVANKKNFYRLAGEDRSEAQLPALWVEKHLSRIESACRSRLDELITAGPGKVTSRALKADLSVFLGLQYTRTIAYRAYLISLITAPAAVKRSVLLEFTRRALEYHGANYTEGELQQFVDHQMADHPAITVKHEALSLMLKDVRNVAAPAFFQRRWALYRTPDPLATCDEPVVFIPGAGHDRTTWLAHQSAAVLYPVDPFHVLVMLLPTRSHLGPFTLDTTETRMVNFEIVAAATRTAFERPGDRIAVAVDVPARPPRPEPRSGELLGEVRPISRWTGRDDGPEWAVPIRWLAKTAPPAAAAH